MTLPNERFRALMYGQDLLRDLLYPSKTPGVPRKIREKARNILRHYPAKYELIKMAELMPKVFDAGDFKDEE